MAETNELLKQFSQEVGGKYSDSLSKSVSTELKIKLDKAEKHLTETVRKEVTNKYDKLVKEKVETCLEQVQEFLKK